MVELHLMTGFWLMGDFWLCDVYRNRAGEAQPHDPDAAEACNGAERSWRDGERGLWNGRQDWQPRAGAVSVECGSLLSLLGSSDARGCTLPRVETTFLQQAVAAS